MNESTWFSFGFSSIFERDIIDERQLLFDEMIKKCDKS